jgi:hypothetical protein
MAKVRAIIHRVISEAWAVLYEELIIVDVDSQGQVDITQVPGINWDTIVNNPSENQVG